MQPNTSTVAFCRPSMCISPLMSLLPYYTTILPRRRYRFSPAGGAHLPCTDFQSPLYEGLTSPVHANALLATSSHTVLPVYRHPHQNTMGLAPHRKRIAAIQVRHSIFPHSSFHSPQSPPSATAVSSSSASSSSILGRSLFNSFGNA